MEILEYKKKLAINNSCYNIDKFKGFANGPTKQINIDNVKNINAFIGDSKDSIDNDSFDIIYSISVIEHVPTEDLDIFFEDSLRILKPGGLFIHAIDKYIEDIPTAMVYKRYFKYKSWVDNHKNVTPTGDIFNGEMKFSTNMVSNPDNILYGWGSFAPALIDLRKKAQNVSIIISGRKI